MDCNRFLLGRQIVFVSCHRVYLASSASHKVIGIFLNLCFLLVINIAINCGEKKQSSPLYETLPSNGNRSSVSISYRDK